MTKDETIAFLRVNLRYDDASGALYWLTERRTPKLHRKIGMEAGHGHNDGYIQISINQAKVLAHRAAWMLFYGEFPNGVIDHINGDKKDNRISNLRLTTNQNNTQNVRNPRVNGKSGFLGVTWNKARSKWVAKIFANGKHVYLGAFPSPKDAHEAYLEAKRRLHAGCTI